MRSHLLILLLRDRILTSCQARSLLFPLSSKVRSHPHLMPKRDRILTSCQNAIASSPHAKCDRIQQLQQQIEAWQALLEKLGGNE
jgi:hypothetical protein